MFARASFSHYFLNSLIVTVVSLFLDAAVRRDGGVRAVGVPLPRQHLLGLYLALGIMIPIRLGTVAILQADGRRSAW